MSVVATVSCRRIQMRSNEKMPWPNASRREDEHERPRDGTSIGQSTVLRRLARDQCSGQTPISPQTLSRRRSGKQLPPSTSTHRCGVRARETSPPSSTAPSTTVTTSSPATSVASHLMETWINLLLGFCENSYKIACLVESISSISRGRARTMDTHLLGVCKISVSSACL